VAFSAESSIVEMAGSIREEPEGEHHLHVEKARGSLRSYSMWGTDIPRVHWKDKRPHERTKGPINHKVIPSWAWGGTTSEAD
jgi:hypothetical protein